MRIPLWVRHPRRWNWCVRQAEYLRYLKAEHPEITITITAGQYYTLRWPPKLRRR